MPACGILEVKCRHYVNLVTSVDGERYPVRIVRGRTYNGKGTYHVQAQRYIDGEWRWRRYSPFLDAVVNSDMDEFYPFKYWSDKKQCMVFDYQYFTPQEYYKRAFARLLNNNYIMGDENDKVGENG